MATPNYQHGSLSLSAYDRAVFPSTSVLPTIRPRDVYTSQGSPFIYSDPQTPPPRNLIASPICPGAPHKSTFVEEQSSVIEPDESMSHRTTLPTANRNIGTSFPTSRPSANISKSWSSFTLQFPAVNHSPASYTTNTFLTHTQYPLALPPVCPNVSSSDSNPELSVQASLQTFFQNRHDAYNTWLHRPLRSAQEDHYSDELALEPHERQVMYAEKDHYCDRLALSPSPEGSEERDLEDNIREVQEEREVVSLEAEKKTTRNVHFANRKIRHVVPARHKTTTQSKTKKGSTQLERSSDFQALQTHRDRECRARKQKAFKLPIPSSERPGTLKDVSGNGAHKRKFRREENPSPSPSPTVQVDGLRRSRRLQRVCCGLKGGSRTEKGKRTQAGKCRAKMGDVASQVEGFRRSERLRRGRG